MPSEKPMTDREREEIAEFQESVRVDKGSLLENLLRIGSGEKAIYKDSSIDDPTGLVDTSIDKGEYVGDHIDFDNVMSNMGYHTGTTKIASDSESKPIVDFGDLTPIIRELATFRFSSNRQEEVNILAESLQEGMDRIGTSRSKLAIAKVTENTKKVSTGASKFFHVRNGGMRCEFSVLNQKYSMLAMGNFNGNEAMCWSVEGNDITGYIMRYNANTGKYNIVNKEFDIQVTSGWKE